MSRRRGTKVARRIEKKRRGGIKATRWMYRLRQISKEDRDELLEFWEKADAETILRVTSKGKADAADQLEASGVGTPSILRKLRRGDRE